MRLKWKDNQLISQGFGRECLIEYGDVSNEDEGLDITKRIQWSRVSKGPEHM